MDPLFSLTGDLVYDPALKAYIDLNVTSTVVPLASVTQDGLMSKTDFTKLSRLYFPAPSSTISSEDCVTNTGTALRFRRGLLRIIGSDFITVEDTIKLQNINYQGDLINEATPYKIHTHTQGININVNTDAFFRYLEEVGQVIVQGKIGKKGATGDRGDRGIDRVLSGPPGDKGVEGKASPCNLNAEPEIIENRPKEGLGQAIIDAYIKTDPVNPKKYNLVFRRQPVGKSDVVANRFRISGQGSTWLLATGLTFGLDGFNDPYYIDIQPILNELKSQFDKRANNLKDLYEERVSVWVQAMSDLFDQQKAALCCALQYCQSAQRNIDTRRHIESLAAAALPDARLAFCPKTSENARFIDKTKACERMDTDVPQCFKRIELICETTTAQVLAQAAGNNIQVSALSNIDSISAATLSLDPGRYVLTVTETDSYIDGFFAVKLKVRYGEGSTISLMDKGEYFSVKDSRDAYVGLTSEINHAGGLIHVWTNTVGSTGNQGSTTLTFTKVDEIYNFKSKPLNIARNTLIDIFNNYADSKSFITRVGGQEYVAVVLGPEHGALYQDLAAKGLIATIAVPLVGDMPIVDYNNFYISESATDAINRSLGMNDVLQVGREIVKNISICFLPHDTQSS